MSTNIQPASTSGSQIVIMPATAEYTMQMEDLMRHVYGVPADEASDDLNAESYRYHLTIFPEGQFIALDVAANRVVGTSTNMRMNFDPAQPVLKPWLQTVGYGWLTTHHPEGEWLYGVETDVHADYRSKGIGRKLTEVRFQLIRALNLRGLVAGSAIMDYHKVADHVPVEQYVQDVIDGKRNDTNLSKQLHMGFQALAVIPDYVPEDWRALGYGVTIVWNNPDYKPGAQIVQPVQPIRDEVALKPVPDPTIAA